MVLPYKENKVIKKLWKVPSMTSKISQRYRSEENGVKAVTDRDTEVKKMGCEAIWPMHINSF